MLLDIALLLLLGGAVVAVSLYLGRAGERPFRAGLDRLAARRAWRVTELPGHGKGRILLQVTHGGAHDWAVTLREGVRRSPGRSDVRRTLTARFHSPLPRRAGGWLAVLPPLPGGARGAAMLGVVSGGRLDADRLLRQRLEGLLPKTAPDSPPQAVEVSGLPEGHGVWAVAADTGEAMPALTRREAEAIAAALTGWRGAEGRLRLNPALALGPESLVVTAGLPVHPLQPAAPVLERLVDGAVTLREALRRG